MPFFWLCVFIIQYICMLSYAYWNIHRLETYSYLHKKGEYTLESTIYKLNAHSPKISIPQIIKQILRNDHPPNVPYFSRIDTHPRKDKILFFVSGAYNLECHSYIVKTMLDLNKHHSPFIDDYEMMCFENSRVSSLIVYDDIAEFIRQMDSEKPIQELILVGYSSGGVVSSHIMYRLNDLTHFSKKIITYDTPWQIRDNVVAFSSNTYYRMDTVFYHKVHSTYSNHYNATNLQQYLKHKKYFNGSGELLEIIRNVHGYDEETMERETGFHLGISPKVVVINLYNTCDPVVYRPAHDAHYERVRNQIQFPVLFVEKNAIGHCSDMCFSTKYLQHLVEAIQYVHPTASPSPSSPNLPILDNVLEEKGRIDKTETETETDN